MSISFISMLSLKNIKFISFIIPIVTLFCSCKNEFKGSDYVAYFGGEIVNPKNTYVLFCKDNEVIDTLKLDKNNRFFILFDSLAPGMYTFKHEREYQYVYFDKNDSIMVRVNSKDFDGSVVFCGRGDQKNNFLIEQYLKNEKDKNSMFPIWDYDVNKFSYSIDSSYQVANKFYSARREEIKWSDEFNEYAKAALDYQYYSKKEFYPIIHKMRTGKDVFESLPKDFYSFRKNIDCNNVVLASYSPFVMYLTQMLNNMGAINYHNHFSEADLSLKTNINKMNIADTLIKNIKVKNTVLNTIAFQYLLEDQNIVNNNIFIDTYYKYSTDKSYENEILKIGNAIQLLKPNFELPIVKLIDKNRIEITSDKVITKKSVIFFWTNSAKSHLEAAHKKIFTLKTKYPNYDFIAININDSQEDFEKVLSDYNFKGISELRCPNFEGIKSKWAINKIYRAIVTGNNGKIKNAFTNIFDVHFEDSLN